MKLCLISSALLAGCVLGCSSAPATSYRVYIDPTLGDAIPTVLQGLQEWEDMTHGGVSFQNVIDTHTPEQGKAEIYITHASRAWLDARALSDGNGNAETYIGYTYSIDNASEVWIADEVLSQGGDAESIRLHGELPSIVKHEVGHALWLSHVQDKSEIMYPNDQRTTTRITCGDVKQYNDIRGLTTICAEVPQ